MNKILAIALLASAPVFAAHAADTPSGFGIRHELATARKEMHTELAKARRELATENLSLGDSLQIGKAQRAKTTLPRAEITPRGDFLIEGKPQDLDAGQRQLLLAYRGQVIHIATQGIEMGERTATAALDAIGNGSIVGLLFSAMTGNLEQRVERMVKTQIEPGVLAICGQLPAVMKTQQELASRLPKFRPYAHLKQDDVANCAKDVRDEFASL
jgi:hypothetical protein